jgi:hypothetical protein
VLDNEILFRAYFNPSSITSYVLQKPTYLGNMPSESKGGTRKCRKNNEHWTHGEVIKLVEGVEKYGVGRWTKVKTHYFSTSIRDPTHLKVRTHIYNSCSQQFKGFSPI